MLNKIQAIFVALLLCFGVCFTQNVFAAPQVFVPQCRFGVDGNLEKPLEVNFDSANTKEINATLTVADNGVKTLVIAFPLGNKVYTKTLTGAYNYAMYKVALRSQDKQELLILSQGKRGTGKTLLNGVTIIGSGEDDTIGELPIAAFTPTYVLNSPLQIRSNRTAVLFRDVVRQMLVIGWNESTKTFDITGTN